MESDEEENNDTPPPSPPTLPAVPAVKSRSVDPGPLLRLLFSRKARAKPAPPTQEAVVVDSSSASEVEDDSDTDPIYEPEEESA